MKNDRTPEIRLPGFTGDWEQRELGEISKLGSSKRVHREDYTETGIPFFRGSEISKLGISSKLEDVLYISEEYYENLKDRYGVPQTGDILITAVGTLGNTYLISDNAPFYFKDGNLIWLSDIQINSQYLNTYLRNGVGNKRVLERAAGSNQKALTMVKLRNVQVLFPSNEEQTKIGAFFANLDQLITFHQKELTTFKQTKQGFLQKMFPKEGESVPEVRFPGFTGEWETRKFQDDIVSIQTGTNLLGSDSNDGTPLIKMGNIQRGYFSMDKLEYLDVNETVSESDLAENGDFLFNTRNTMQLVGKGATWFGESGKYAFNSNIARFTFKGINTYFFNYLYNAEGILKQISARAVGTTSVAAVYPRDLNSVKYMVPLMEEQAKISNFFKQLDDTITLHQQELDFLQETKKAFLQKMFI